MAEHAPDENQNISEFNQFLHNNNDLLLQKYRQYFVIDSVPIKSIDPNTIVKFINDIFSFDRYQADVKQKLSVSLKENYREFVSKNPNIKEFTSKIAIEILKFCIENNKMFAVKYEKQANKQSEAPHIQIVSTEKQQQKNQQEMSNNPKIQLDSAFDSNQNKSNVSNQFADQGLRRQNNSFLLNQFQFHEDIKYDFDPVLINKNIVIMFEYYCKQQMALSPNLSFERIQEESKTLTLSKLLLMARMMNIMNSVITKQVLTAKFRAISQGKTRIDLKKFQIMFNQLQIMDPSLIARAQLNSHNIQNHLKTTKKPFDTQDTNPRQLIKNRPFIRKLTMHSGKMEQDLIAQLSSRKSEMLPEKSEKMRKYEQIIAQAKSRYRNHVESSVFSTKKLVQNPKRFSEDLSGGLIRHIVDDKDDQKYLQQYRIKIPAAKRNKSVIKQRSERSSIMIKQLKNRIRQIQKTQQQSTNNMEETRPYLYSPSKKF